MLEVQIVIDVEVVRQVARIVSCYAHLFCVTILNMENEHKVYYFPNLLRQDN